MGKVTTNTHSVQQTIRKKQTFVYLHAQLNFWNMKRLIKKKPHQVVFNQTLLFVVEYHHTISNLSSISMTDEMTQQPR
jgi:hypothetical protein